MVNFHNIDCMELMRDKPDGYWDLAVVDPEYGINIAKNGVLHNNSKYSRGFKTNKKYKPVSWDSKIPDKKYFDELKRVSIKQIIFGGNFFFDYLESTRSFIVWYKKGADKNPNFSPAEFAWTNCDGLPKVYFVDWIGFGYINSSQKKIHPTEKPILLYRNILNDYGTKGIKILDTHGGSMSSAIACDIEGFDLDICEIDKEYFDAGVQRFNEYKRQLKLF